jgi:uncharacterized protein (UPF0548 family)
MVRFTLSLLSQRPFPKQASDVWASQDERMPRAARPRYSSLAGGEGKQAFEHATQP